jgi:hypothetical protein
MSGSDCASHNCVDHLCCDSSCTSDCFACDLPGTLGTCTQVPSGVDWRHRCPGGGLCKATCDASGLCSYPATQRACASPGCVSATLLHRAMSCDGTGACLERGAMDCTPFACRHGSCPASCVDNSDCATPNLCVNQTCGLNLPLGMKCTSAGECRSGYCADGVCCENACKANCMACGGDGLCRVAVGADPHHECSGEGLCTGLCSASQSCNYPISGTRCDTCKGCDGIGGCNQALADDDACMTVSCGALSTECLKFADLTAMRCASAGLCAASNDPVTCTQSTAMPDGTACSGGACVAGQCVAGATPMMPTPDKHSGCAFAGTPAPAPLLVLLLAGLSARGVRSRRSPRRRARGPADRAS